MENNTLDWYRENAEAFIANTGKVDMSAHYNSFLELVPSGGYVMDLGCGAGSASLYFTQNGYRVLAVDGCAEFCEHTRQRAGCEARNMRFDELDYTDTFDGIWACASLLHVRKADLLRALLGEAGGFRIKNIWHTHDARPERADELWVNVICLAEKDI